MNVTLDTTVIARAIFPPMRKKPGAKYDEMLRLHSLALPIIRNVESGKDTSFVPSICIVETASIGARLTGKHERGIEGADFVRSISGIVYDTDLLAEAIEIAAGTRISGFDIMFIACAKTTGSVLITDDRKMFETAVKIKVPAKFLRNM